jgi:hypothetical protein
VSSRAGGVLGPGSGASSARSAGDGVRYAHFVTTRYEELEAPFARISRAVGLERGLGSRLSLLRELTSLCGWGERSVDRPLLPSGIRHGAPWGVSMVVGAGAPEVRVLVEAQHDPPSARAYWEAGARVSSWIARQPGADLSRLLPVAERFVPSERSRFRIWHAVAFRPDAPPAFRLYLCASGDTERLRGALDRLGFPRALDAIPPGEITILSLDLRAGGRVKLYLATPDAPPDDARLLLGDDRRIMWLRCFAFTGEGPPAHALHLSLERHVPDAAPRLRSLLSALGLDAAPYERCLPARHHFVSLQRPGGEPRVTIHFLPEVAR